MTGSSFLGKYQILGELGKGGFATVYRARDPDLGREVALKVLDPLLTRDPVWVARFRREARAVASLDHPRVVTVHEIGQAEGSLYIAMRLVEGGSLKQRIETEGALPWDEVVRLAGQIAEALDFAHGQGVLHRDLKPANVLLDTRLGAVLTDFGFASLVADNSLSISMSGGIVGTPAYIAPEVWEGDDPTPQTDIYALGCIVYEMVSGQALFGGASTPAVMRAHFQPRKLPDAWPEGTPPGMTDLLLIALAQEPPGRYVVAGEFSSALAGLRNDPLAAPYAELQDAMSAGRWQEALALAGQVRAVDPDYRDVAALVEAAQAGLHEARLAAPYAELQVAVEGGRWQEALALAEQVRAMNASYRDVVALEAAGLAGLEQAARVQQAAAWREEAERALTDGDLKSAGMAAKKWQELLPDDPGASEFQTRLEQAKLMAAAAHWRAEAERALADERLTDAREAAQRWQEQAPDDPACGEFVEGIERARLTKEIAWWRAEAEEALAVGNFKNAGYTLNKWKQLVPDDPAADDFRKRLIEATGKPPARQQAADHSVALPKPDESSPEVTAVGHPEVRLPNDVPTAPPSPPVPTSTPPVSRSSGDRSKAWWLVPVALTIVALLVIISISNAARREREVALQAAQANTVAASETERAIAAVASEATATADAGTPIARETQAANAAHVASTQTAAPRVTATAGVQFTARAQMTAEARPTATARARFTARAQMTAEARPTATVAAIQTARSSATEYVKTADARWKTATALEDKRARATANAQPRASVRSTANIRSGPGTEFSSVGSASQGETFVLTGKTASSDWFYVGKGWINSSLLEVSGDTSSLDTRRAPVAISPWRGEYFANTNLQGTPVLVREDKVLDFNWHGNSPAPGVPEDFSARWTGSLFVPVQTMFCINRDDFARVWVNGNLLYDVWTYDGGGQGRFPIGPGKHTVRIDWADTGGSASIGFKPC